MTLACPTCNSTTIKKNGHIHNEKQNHQCLNCGRQFVIDPQNKIISEEKRSFIRQSLLERVSLEGVCRVFNVSMPWLLQFINEIIHELPEDLNAKVTSSEDLEVAVIELDEQWSYVGNKKNQQWLCLFFILQHLKSKPYSYGKHLVPNDAAVHEYSTGLSRVEVAKNHGLHFTLVPAIGINEGIDAVRNMFNRCWFDEVKCAKGVAALESYKKQWNDRHGCWSSHPLHNFASHGADAFRMLAVGIGRLASKGLSAEDWKRMRLEHLV